MTEGIVNNSQKVSKRNLGIFMALKIVISSFIVFLLASCQSTQKEETVKHHEIEIAPIQINVDVDVDVDVKIHGEKEDKVEKDK